MLRVHKVRDHINGPHNALYARRLDLGWVIAGDVCLGTVHKPLEANVYKTNILCNDHVSSLRPRPNSIHVKEDYGGTFQRHSAIFPACEENTSFHVSTDKLRYSVFGKSKDDNKSALSIDDKAFLAIMVSEVYQNEGNSWVAQLLFRAPRRRLPSNREQALKCFCSLR